jgi:uncharacterized protein (DUF983 family)
MAMGLLRRTREPKQVIDLRDPVSGPLQWGSPVPCPSCTGRGYLDHIDPFREIMYLHCTRCGHRYELAKADIDRVHT